MTSANFFNGYACDKPASRIIAPPGGRSNNIFGCDEPVASAPEKKNNINNNNAAIGTSIAELTPQQQAHANKMHQNCGINLFDDGSSRQNIPITQSHRGAGIKTKEDSHCDIFGNSVGKPIDRQKSKVFEEQTSANNTVKHANKPRSGYNTITGQTYENEQEERENSAKIYEAHQAEIGIANEMKTKSLHTSSRVLQPPGGRSTGLW